MTPAVFSSSWEFFKTASSRIIIAHHWSISSICKFHFLKWQQSIQCQKTSRKNQFTILAQSTVFRSAPILTETGTNKPITTLAQCTIFNLFTLVFTSNVDGLTDGWKRTFVLHLPSNRQTCEQTAAQRLTMVSLRWERLQTSSAQYMPDTWWRLAPSLAQYQPDNHRKIYDHHHRHQLRSVAKSQQISPCKSARNSPQIICHFNINYFL